MSAIELTVKQEKFCQVYIETGNASEAYRQSYNAEKMKEATVWRKAAELTSNGKVTARLGILREELSDKFEITIESITNMLKEDRKLAQKEGQASAAVSASMNMAKLHGLVVEKKTITGKLTFSDILEELDGKTKGLPSD